MPRSRSPGGRESGQGAKGHAHVWTTALRCAHGHTKRSNGYIGKKKRRRRFDRHPVKRTLYLWGGIMSCAPPDGAPSPFGHPRKILPRD